MSKKKPPDFFPEGFSLCHSELVSESKKKMLNLRSIAARRLAKNSPLDCFCPASQCRSLGLDVISKTVGTTRMAEATESLSLKLTDTLTCYVKIKTNLFESK